MSKSTKIILSSFLVALTMGMSAVHAETTQTNTPPARPSEEKMQAVRDCASKKGVELPAPPAEGRKGEHHGRPPEGSQQGTAPLSGEGSGRPQGGPPKLTDDQKAVLDACFAANGLTPPKGAYGKRR